MVKLLTRCILSLLLVCSLGCATLSQQRHWSERILRNAHEQSITGELYTGEFQIGTGNGYEKEVLRLMAHLSLYCGVVIRIADLVPQAQAWNIPKPDQLHGITKTYDNGISLIVLSNLLTSHGRLEVLTHEAGHAFQPLGLENEQAEVFAELVSYKLLEIVGYENELNASYYLSFYTDGQDEFIKPMLPYIDNIADGLGAVLRSEEVHSAKGCAVDKLN